jgi:hypothetical protein
MDRLDGRVMQEKDIDSFSAKPPQASFNTAGEIRGIKPRLAPCDFQRFFSDLVE